MIQEDACWKVNVAFKQAETWKTYFLTSFDLFVCLIFSDFDQNYPLNFYCTFNDLIKNSFLSLKIFANKVRKFKKKTLKLE